MSAPEETESKQQSSEDAALDATAAETEKILDRLRQQQSPAKAFDLLKSAVQEYSPVSILSQLTNRFLFVRRGDFHEESSEIHREHAQIEFLAGFLAAQPFPRGELKELTVSRCDEIRQRLRDYYLAVQRDLSADALERSGPLHELEFDAKNHSLAVRGDAYPHQFEQMAVGLYEEHDAWFQRALGFTIREALHAVRATMDLVAWRRHQVLSTVDSAHGDQTSRAEALARHAEDILEA